MAAAVTTTRRTTKTKTKTSANTDVLENQHIKLRKTLPPEAIIPVINGFQGKLIAQNRRTHEEFIWEEFGDVQDLTFADVKSIYSTDKAFFSNNWFLFEDTLVLEVLNAEKYYTNALTVEDFDTLFDKTSDEIKAIVSKLNRSQRMSVCYKARNAVANHEIDSLSVITALEESLGVKLVDR